MPGDCATARDGFPAAGPAGAHGLPRALARDVRAARRIQLPAGCRARPAPRIRCPRLLPGQSGRLRLACLGRHQPRTNDYKISRGSASLERDVVVEFAALVTTGRRAALVKVIRRGLLLTAATTAATAST